MTDDTQGLHDDDELHLHAPGHSVLEFLQSRTGDAPRVTLRDEDSATVSSPVIDPSSRERTSVPQGRGTYQLMGEIARGGMGVILKGHDTDLGRDVAVKVLDKRLSARPEVVQRFVEEAQIGGQLQHPGIVPVYELGLMADERPYFTMKLVKGRTLATLLAERGAAGEERRRLLDVFESVCQTMAYAHSRGVIHRDLKPANVMVGAFGEVQVVDWGLAKVLARGGTADEKRAREARSQMTVLETVRSAEGSGSGSESMVGSIMGTPAYMPPEQASGMVDRLDERSDVFSLGAILCEILTGLPPYTGERGEIIAAAAQAEHDEALARLDACGADPALVKLAKQCLLAAPAARPANAGVVAERVHEHVVSLEERAQSARVEAAEARVRMEQEQKARKLTLALAAAVLGMLVVGGGGWVFVQNERAASERAEVARQREAAVRDQELAAGVNRSLDAAAVLRGQGSYDDAIQETGRARALAEGGGASDELLARVDATLADLRRSQDEARRDAELARETQLLLSEVQSFRDPEWNRGWNEVANDYEEAFRLRGIDLDAGDAESAAEMLIARGLGSEIALVLDAWAEIRRRARDERGALRLLEIAHFVDPDPRRADLREAANNRELDVLLWIVENGFADQPAATIELLASALNRLGDRETSVRVYREGIELHPGDFSLVYSLARLFTPNDREPGDPDEMREAIGLYRAALALRPEAERVRYDLGRVLGKLGSYEAAVEQYTIVHVARPDEGPVLARLGGAYWRLGEHERALPFLQRAAEAERRGWWTQWSVFFIGRALRDLGDVEGALARFEEAVELLPREVVVQNELVGLLLSTPGHEEETDLALRRARSLFPDNAVFANNLAWFLATAEREEARDYDEAVSLAERACDLGPGEANNWNTLGVARYMAGDLEGTVRDLGRSVDLAGGGILEDWLFLAMAYHRLGNEEAGRVWYDRAVIWMRRNPTQEADRLRFRAMADALFGG